MNTFFVTLLCLPLLTSTLPEPDFKANFLDIWGRARAYTLEVAEAMPESAYDFRPMPEVMSFREQLLHVSRNLHWITATLLGKNSPPEESSWENLSKKELIAVLEKSFSYVEETAQSFPMEALDDTLTFAGTSINKERLFYLMRDHLTHHRAQCILYLRMKGIAPPSYRGW